MREGSGGGSAPPRPTQVTVAGVVAAIACALLVLTLFDVMAQVRSSQTRDSVSRFLSTYPGDQLGLGVDGAVSVLRGLVLLSGALAAAGVVLAVYALRRHRGARVGLAVVAALMLFSTSFVSGLLPLVVAFAAATLWRREARDWFAGVTPSRSAATGAGPGMAAWQPPPSAGPPTAGPLSTLPPPTSPAAQGRSPVDAGWAPPTATDPVQWSATAPADQGRPVAVTVAAWLTWVAAGLVTLLLGWLVVVLVVDPDGLVSALRDESSISRLNATDDDVVRALWLVAAFGITWALAAMALAALALHRIRAGRVGLIVSALAAAVAGAVTVVIAAVGLATVVLLLLPSVSRWYAGAAPAPPPAPGQGPDQLPPTGPLPGEPSRSDKPPVW